MWPGERCSRRPLWFLPPYLHVIAQFSYHVHIQSVVTPEWVAGRSGTNDLWVVNEHLQVTRHSRSSVIDKWTPLYLTQGTCIPITAYQLTTSIPASWAMPNVFKPRLSTSHCVVRQAAWCMTHVTWRSRTWWSPSKPQWWTFKHNTKHNTPATSQHPLNLILNITCLHAHITATL